jgi:3-phenylpropionate/cinnamic acid dioxygenase small subunit
MVTSTTRAAFPKTDLSLAVTAGVYHDIQHFLFREAMLLDHRRFDEWTELLAKDAVFRIPARFAREIGIAPPVGVDHFHDDRQGLVARIKVLQQRDSVAAGQQTSATQIRRMITNVVVCPCDREEYNVLSYLLLTRSRPGEAQSTVFSAERHDRLRGSPQKLRIVRREIVIDQKNANIDIDMYL